MFFGQDTLRVLPPGTNSTQVGTSLHPNTSSPAPIPGPSWAPSFPSLPRRCVDGHAAARGPGAAWRTGGYRRLRVVDMLGTCTWTIQWVFNGDPYVV